MKTLTLILCYLFIQSCYGQVIDSKKTPQLQKVFYSQDSLTTECGYHISCNFLSKPDSNQLRNVFNKNNWAVRTEAGKEYIVTEIKKTPLPEKYYIEGNFEPVDALYLLYIGEGNQKVEVQADTAITKHPLVNFGEGQKFQLSLRRLATQKYLFAADYNTKITLIGSYFYPENNNNFYFQSYNINLFSTGTISNSSEVENYTQSGIDLALIPYVFTGKLIYRNEIHFGYVVETKIGSSYFNIINRSMNVGAKIELPYTNYPMYYVNQYTHYLRLAMPLTVEFNYFPQGSDSLGNTTLARYDIGVLYELAFSPYLIIRAEWDYSKYLNSPAGFDNNKSYTAITFAQDLVVWKDYLSLLKLIFGNDNIGDKNFIFYKIEAGSKAPNFIPINQQSIGFAIYF